MISLNRRLKRIESQHAQGLSLRELWLQRSLALPIPKSKAEFVAEGLRRLQEIQQAASDEREQLAADFVAWVDSLGAEYTESELDYCDWRDDLLADYESFNDLPQV